MKRVLLAVCGLTPQIITETLYALHYEGRLPQRVVVLTTRAGRERCLNTLFDGPGMLHRFFDDYGIAPSACRFGREDILTPAPPADDIATLEESEAFQTLCMEQTRLLAGEPDVTVDFSIAGGRKTMGASLALAAQCYAGAEDRLFHVLVSPAFESQPDFFYPPPGGVLLPRPAPRPPLDTRDAHVTLSVLPFARLRPWLPPHLLQQPQAPESLLASLDMAQMPVLRLNTKQRCVSVQGKNCILPPVEFSILLYFALRKRNFPCSGSCQDCGNECFMELQTFFAESDSLAELYRHIRISAAASSTTGILNLSAENFRTYKAKLHRYLRCALGMDAPCAEIASLDARPHVRYGLRLPRSRIIVEQG